MDAAAAAEIGALEELLDRAQRHDEANGTETARDVAKRLQELEAQAEDSRVRFVLEAITHRTYQQLRTDHPPTKEQTEAAAKRGGEEEPAFDPDTFAPALVAAQLIEPKPADPEEFAAFWDDLSDGQLVHRRSSSRPASSDRLRRPPPMSCGVSGCPPADLLTAQQLKIGGCRG